MPASANGLAPVYYPTGAHATAGLRVDYDISEDLTVGLAAATCSTRTMS